MRMRRIAFVVAMALLGGACKGQGQSAAATPGGEASAPAQTPAAAQETDAPPAKPVPAQLPDVLATVDTDKVERWEIEAALKGLEARAGTALPAEKRDEVIRGLVDQLVAFHAMSQEARERKLGATDAEVEGRLAQIKGGFPNEAEFLKAMAEQGVTLPQLQRQTRMGLEINKLIETEIAAKVTVADSEVDAFYQQNLQRFAEGESVHASHILVTAPASAEAAEKEKAKAKAQDLLKQLKGGADFAKLAREQSQDPGTAPGGGDLGFFPKGQMDPAFETAAFNMKAGGVSEVVESQFGFHLIKLHERRPARTTPLAEVSGQIKEYLTNQQRDSKIQEFVDASKAKRKVQILI
jgi:peptidyl-prolyl cis-trans isomerase C